MIQSTTKNGTPVTLIGEEYCGEAVVRMEFVHPKDGAVVLRSHEFGSIKGGEGALSWFGAQRACITIPRADFTAAMTEARNIGERELADLKSGAKKIKVTYHDGEYLSGHGCGGRAGKLLVELGLAEEVSGWGTHVDGDVVKALGEEFTYAAAAEFARPAQEAKQARADAKKSGQAEKFAMAKTTGQPVLIRQWSEGCDGTACECDLDMLTEYAQPDGTTTRQRVHTH